MWTCALPTFTIDPDDARDFDDAVSASREDGHVRLWVHIADVSAYVRPGRGDRARGLRRGTSVYVPGAVEPMLPEALSNGACSLRPGEDRLAVTVEIEMDGSDVRRRGLLSLACSQRPALTYGEVDAIFAGEPGRGAWGEALAAAREVAAALRGDARLALEVGSPEPAFEFDDDGHVTARAPRRQTESHGLIEHLMILANEQVAGYLADRGADALPGSRAAGAAGGRLPGRAAREPRGPRRRCPSR